jgi:hypothetical protein
VEAVTVIGKPKPVKEKKAKTVPAKTRRKLLVAKLDEITSLYVRLRDGCCVTCGSTAMLQCGHLITRSHYAVRWDTDFNTNAQCASCNLTHEYNPHIYIAWFLREHGLERYQWLLKQDVPRKWTEAELTEKLAEIQGLYDALKHRSIYIEKG